MKPHTCELRLGQRGGATAGRRRRRLSAFRGRSGCCRVRGGRGLALAAGQRDCERREWRTEDGGQRATGGVERDECSAAARGAGWRRAHVWLMILMCDCVCCGACGVQFKFKRQIRGTQVGQKSEATAKWGPRWSPKGSQMVLGGPK